MPAFSDPMDPSPSSAVSVNVEIKIDANAMSPEQVGATLRETLAALEGSEKPDVSVSTETS